MKKISDLVYQKINEMENISSLKIDGAMYGFPEIKLSDKILKEAKEAGMEADLMYVLQLLDETGIIFVPGSGFGQKPGTFHLRMTILGNYQMMQEALALWDSFNNRFMGKT